MVENPILLERVTHELAGYMTHVATAKHNSPKIHALTQLRNFAKRYE
tara:strand:- start:1463 stop:1603 length:141 start_codon:yes stop_codon:yes gene_type:complete